MARNEQMQHKQKITDMQLQLLQQQQSIDSLGHSLPRNPQVKMGVAAQPSVFPGPSAYMGNVSVGKVRLAKMRPGTLILKL